MLSHLPEETVEEYWHSLCEVWKTTCKTVLGKKMKKHRVAVNGNLDTNHREKTAERPNQPDTRPGTKARTTSTLLGDKLSSKKKCKRKEKLH